MAPTAFGNHQRTLVRPKGRNAHQPSDAGYDHTSGQYPIDDGAFPYPPDSPYPGMPQMVPAMIMLTTPSSRNRGATGARSPASPTPRARSAQSAHISELGDGNETQEEDTFGVPRQNVHPQQGQQMQRLLPRQTQQPQQAPPQQHRRDPRSNQPPNHPANVPAMNIKTQAHPQGAMVPRNGNQQQQGRHPGGFVHQAPASATPHRQRAPQPRQAIGYHHEQPQAGHQLQSQGTQDYEHRQGRASNYGYANGRRHPMPPHHHAPPAHPSKNQSPEFGQQPVSTRPPSTAGYPSPVSQQLSSSHSDYHQHGMSEPHPVFDEAFGGDEEQTETEHDADPQDIEPTRGVPHPAESVQPPQTGGGGHREQANAWFAVVEQNGGAPAMKKAAEEKAVAEKRPAKIKKEQFDMAKFDTPFAPLQSISVQALWKQAAANKLDSIGEAATMPTSSENFEKKLEAIGSYFGEVMSDFDKLKKDMDSALKKKRERTTKHEQARKQAQTNLQSWEPSPPKRQRK